VALLALVLVGLLALVDTGSLRQLPVVGETNHAVDVLCFRASGHASLYTTQMRASFLAVLLVGCWTAPPPPAPPVPNTIPASTSSCNDAAFGIDRGTRDLRGPDTPIVGPLRARCIEDQWSADAIDCFTKMAPDDLGRCAGLLDEKRRDKLFTVIGGSASTTDRATLAVAIAKLQAMKSGIPECDSFFSSVERILGCNEMPIQIRIQLGNETVDSWALPTSRLPADAIKRMAIVCDQTRGELEQRAVGAGCKL